MIFGINKKNQCPICYKNMRLTNFDSCQHKFCKKCLKKWEKYSNTCPLCRKKKTNQDQLFDSCPPSQDFTYVYQNGQLFVMNPLYRRL